MKATIWHNPACGTSRKTLAILMETPGVDVTVVEYLKTPPGAAKLAQLYRDAGMTPQQGLRLQDGRGGTRLARCRGRRRSGRDGGRTQADRAAFGRNRQGCPPVPPTGSGPSDPLNRIRERAVTVDYCPSRRSLRQILRKAACQALALLQTIHQTRMSRVGI
jgi:hypothetical protein